MSQPNNSSIHEIPSFLYNLLLVPGINNNEFMNIFQQHSLKHEIFFCNWAYLWYYDTYSKI